VGSGTPLPPLPQYYLWVWWYSVVRHINEVIDVEPG